MKKNIDCCKCKYYEKDDSKMVGGGNCTVPGIDCKFELLHRVLDFESNLLNTKIGKGAEE